MLAIELPRALVRDDDDGDGSDGVGGAFEDEVA